MIAVTDLIDAGFEAVRPLDPRSPSEFAEDHRVVEGGPFAGKWDNENGPHLVGIMEAVKEAIETGRHLVVIKGAQEGVTDALGINAIAWLLTYYPGPILYLTSTVEVAEELVHDRWEGVLRTCEPLKRKHLGGKTNSEKIHIKRFVDAKLTLGTSGSMFTFLSQPYAVVVFDELDAGMDYLRDGSDPIAIVSERLTAMAEGRPVLLIAFAHPTTKDRGAAKLYYRESDQRRAHVQCPHCSEWVAPLWKDVKVFPREGQSAAGGERDPSCYEFVSSCCGATWSNADRLKAIRVVEQRSTLPAETARAKKWIGLHTWHFFLRKGGQVEELAAKHIAGLDDEGKAIVFDNKVCGDAHEVEEQDVTIDAWEQLALPAGVEGSFERGKLVPEIQWLTAGQDSGVDELHWLVAGWGYVRSAEGVPTLCGWLVDWGVEAGPRRVDARRQTLDASDLFVFDQLLYGRLWPRVDGREFLPLAQVFHDSGWQPSAIYEYCRTKRARGFPSKGGNDDDRSRAGAVTWGAPPRWRVGEVEVTDPNLNLAHLNTYRLKCDVAGLTGRRFKDARSVQRLRLVLPQDPPVDLLEQLASERLIRERGRKRWVRRGPNHWWDSLVMAHAAALNIAASLRTVASPKTETETRVAVQAQVNVQSRAVAPRGRSGKGRIRRKY